MPQRNMARLVQPQLVRARRGPLWHRKNGHMRAICSSGTPRHSPTSWAAQVKLPACCHLGDGARQRLQQLQTEKQVCVLASNPDFGSAHSSQPTEGGRIEIRRLLDIIMFDLLPTSQPYS